VAKNTLIVLPAYGEREYRINLSQRIDLTLDGNYAVQISRLLPAGAAVIASPLPLNVTALPRNPTNFEMDSSFPQSEVILGNVL
jgi:hypothetical protein